MISKTHKEFCAILVLLDTFLFSFYNCWIISISVFTFLIGISIEITSSITGLKICVITARIKKYKSIINKKKKKHDQMILLAKSKLNSIEVLISKALIDSVISYDEIILINHVLREYKEMKEKNKKFKDLMSLSKI